LKRCIHSIKTPVVRSELPVDYKFLLKRADANNIDKTQNANKA